MPAPAAMIERLLERSLLSLILLAYLVLGYLYATLTPPWQVPDEPAHYNYIRQVVETGCCPVIVMGDWDQAYLDVIKAARFSPDALAGRLATIQYEDHQPPLYYLLAAPIYAASGGDLVTLRLFSLTVGGCLVIVAWGTVRLLGPAQPWLALGAAAFVAFLPQHLAMLAGINNDSLAELIVGLTLFGCLAYLGNGGHRGPLVRLAAHPLTLGVLVGLAFLTKLTAYPLVAVVGVTVLLRAGMERWGMSRVIGQAAWVLIPALLLGSLWWLRNLSVYGGFDVLAQVAHDRVVVGQPTTADYIAANGQAAWARFIAQTTFNSFWGQFGWMGVPMTERIYSSLGVVSAALIVGAGINLVRGWPGLTTPQRLALAVFALLTSLAMAAHLYYNLKFIQPQGRYLYPALIPVGALAAAGVAGWVSFVAGRWPLLRWATAVLMGSMAAFALYVLLRILVPALA